MRRTLFLIFAVVSVAGMIAMSGCKKNEDDGGNGGNNHSGKKATITSDEQAAQIARQMWFAINEIDYALDDGTYSDEVIYASGSGNAKVSGTVHGYVGSYMTTRQTDSDLTIVFDHYSVGGDTYIETSEGYCFTGTITLDQSKFSSSKYKFLRYVKGSNIELTGNGLNDVISVDLQRYHSSSTVKDKRFPLAGSVVSSTGESFSAYDGWVN